MKNLTWPAVTLVAVLGGLAFALLAFTDIGTGEVLGLIGVLGGVGGAAVGTAGSAGVQNRVDEIHTETQAQTAVLETVERRTNGELDERIEAAMARAREDGAEQAVAQVIEALRKEGVIRR